MDFIVPPRDELLDETISTWIEQDVEAMFEQMERVREGVAAGAAGAGRAGAAEVPGERLGGAGETGRPGRSGPGGEPEAEKAGGAGGAGAVAAAADHERRRGGGTASSSQTPGSSQKPATGRVYWGRRPHPPTGDAPTPAPAPASAGSEPAADRRPRSGNGHGVRPAADEATVTPASSPDTQQTGSPISSAPPTSSAPVAPVAPATPRPELAEVMANAADNPTIDSPAYARIGDITLTYPTSLRREPLAPYLVIAAVKTTGVTMAFDSIWLTHEGFRASMPVQCAFSGRVKRDHLIARPMIFEDQCLTNRRMLDTVTAAHENRHLGEHAPREILRLMGELPHLAVPFNQPMPYYVSTRHAHLTLFCLTRNRTDGGVTCEVLVPDPHTALAWVANVNGVCGPEYELLEREVALMHGEAWRDLSETCRQRLGVWCRLQPNERLRLYISDADFGRRDEGLGGLVITDQRLVYCKYHHRGQVRLDEEAVILVRHDNQFASLILQQGADRSRMVKIHMSDLEQLLSALESAPGLRYELHGLDQPGATSN